MWKKDTMFGDASERWKELPLHEAALEPQRSVIARVDQILALKPHDLRADNTNLKSELDKLAAELYRHYV